MDLRVLRTLLAVADEGSFVKGGQRVGLTQSAISLHVQTLEQELGTNLFDRSRRPPVLTAEGRIVVDRVRDIVRLYDELSVSLGSDGEFEAIELGAVPTTLTGILPPAVASLRANHPQLRVRITSGLSHELERKVVSGEIDAALVTKPETMPESITWYDVDAEPLMVIAPAATVGERDRDVLELLPYIKFRRFAWAGEVIDAQLRARHIEVTTLMEVDSLEAVAALVSAGLGASVVPCRSIAEPFPATVRALPFGETPVLRTVGLMHRADYANRHLMRRVVDHLRLAVESTN
ncbi:MAG: LysR family transcriptional regulator [Pseudomonadota bacterium]